MTKNTETKPSALASRIYSKLAWFIDDRAGDDIANMTPRDTGDAAALIDAEIRPLVEAIQAQAEQHAEDAGEMRCEWRAFLVPEARAALAKIGGGD